jgi:hypothetical protein
MDAKNHIQYADQDSVTPKNANPNPQTSTYNSLIQYLIFLSAPALRSRKSELLP